MTHTTAENTPPKGKVLATLTLGALGVVYGDIGTSPLYAMRECFHGPNGIEADPANVLGVLSLITWSLILVVTVKYLLFVMRADNEGEGGMFALSALLSRAAKDSRFSRNLKFVALALFGAALFYGDGMITPAISVLSAVEGLEVATPFFKPYVIPIAIAILVGLFLFQRRGTGRVGAVFGPITVVWFITLATLGVVSVVETPEVFEALNPVHGWRFFTHNGRRGFLVLGAVFLVITGCEALYADMGHFGRRPIRLAWLGLVLPSLLANYYGQGALVLRDPASVENPFYLLAPSWAVYPLVFLATVATVIASQAVISGAFSLTRQAVQLGYLPRLEIRHTSREHRGQIYVPWVNWTLLVCVVLLVLGFRSSSNLAAAYGIAVATDMVITSFLVFATARSVWHWNRALAGLMLVAFLVIDIAFFGANAMKIPQGGYFPLMVGAAMFTLLITWKQGRALLYERMAAGMLPIKDFLESFSRSRPTQVPGTAVFMTGNPGVVPHALLHNLKHNKVLHERVVFLNVVTEEKPYAAESDRLKLERLKEPFWRLSIHYGFMESPDIVEVLAGIEVDGKPFDPMDTSFFLGRENLIATRRGRMRLWRKKLFVFISRNAVGATSFFRLPPNRVVELGQQLEL